MNSQRVYLDNLGYGDVQQELRQAASVELFMFPWMFWFFGFFIPQIYVYKNLAIIWAKAQMFKVDVFGPTNYISFICYVNISDETINCVKP